MISGRSFAFLYNNIEFSAGALRAPDCVFLSGAFNVKCKDFPEFHISRGAIPRNFPGAPSAHRRVEPKPNMVILDN